MCVCACVQGGCERTVRVGGSALAVNRMDRGPGCEDGCGGGGWVTWYHLNLLLPSMFDQVCLSHLCHALPAATPTTNLNKLSD